MKPAAIRVETLGSLQSREAILDVLHEVMRAKDVPSIHEPEEGITEVSLDELAEYVTAVAQERQATRMRW